MTNDRDNGSDSARDNANVRFPPPLIYAGFLIVGIVAGRALGLPRLGLGDTLRNLLGWVLVAAGIAVDFAGAGLFRRSGTAIIPFKPASRLVTSGIYRWTRNPMYLGMALLYAGVAILFDSLLALLLLSAVVVIVQAFVISREEAYLERAFGEDYRSYRKRVRRWL